jgi:hypothetical protein
MRDFKFFQKGTTDMMDDEVRATASFNADTPEGYMNRRMLYHTNRGQYDRLRHPNNEMEQYFYERGFRETPRGQFGTPERHQDIIRRINEQRDLINTDNQRGFFQPITVTKINPKWWMKIKMFFQEVNFNGEIVGIIFIAGSLTIAAILTISKLLNAW